MKLQKEEAKIKNYILILVVALVIVGGLLVAHSFSFRAQKKNIKEEVKKEIFDKIEKYDQKKAQVELQYINYQKLLNISNLTEYLTHEIQGLVTDIDQDYMREFQKNSIKQRFQKNLTELDHQLKLYLKQENILKEYYNDGVHLSEHLQRKYFEYENCRKNIRLGKDRLLSSTLDLQRTRMEEMRGDVELYDIEKELDHKQQIQKREYEQTRLSIQFYKDEINNQAVSTRDSNYNEEMLKKKLQENGQLDVQILEQHQQQLQFDQQINRIR